ncbi:MAG TPA: CRTAC1 family protein, partial [Gemmataceae bacterium]|nr:CRTAC1 family protein [Gemmataceae bacterium]
MWSGRVRLWFFRCLLVLLGSWTAGCGSRVPEVVAEPGAPCWFEDVTAQVDLNFVHDAGPTGRYFMPQVIGSGAAFFDFDNDGRLDIYLVQNGGPDSRSKNRLFRQGTDGRFTDVSAGSGLDIAGYGMGVAIGDVNNDGWPDVLVTEYGGVRLFLNKGNGTFADVTKAAGLDSLLWATSAAFVDYDRDGWLDLVIVDYVNYDASRPCANAAGQPDFCTPRTFEGTVTKLYRNLGAPSRQGEGETKSSSHPVPVSASVLEVPRFQDVTLESGLGTAPGPGLGVVCADFNGDHWPDIFVANDAKPNHLWINQRNGTFKEEAVLRGIAYNAMGKAEGNMGIALGDVDDDGLFDVFVTHLNDETHRLWKQGPRGMFQDRTAAADLAKPRWRGTGFGTVLADFDHDGALDLALVNGGVTRRKSIAATAGGSFWTPYMEPNQLFRNDGKGKFREVSESNPPFCGVTAVWRGLACGDFDNDGALDLLVTAIGGPARLYRNVAPKRGHWLMIRALDPARKRDAYGAEIVVRAGERRWLRWINPAYSYLCSNDPRAHFGLGAAERVDTIQVVWPDGTEETFPGCA